MPHIFKYSPILLLFLAFEVSAQLVNPEYERYSTDEGLSQSHVFSILQDHTGFIWIATDDGLNRFDGHDFKIFKNEEVNSNSIVDNSIRALLLDRDSSIWIGTNNGVCRYNPNTESMQHYPIDYTDSTKLKGSQVSSILQHPDGSTWISYIGDGVEVIIPGQKTILHYTINRGDRYKIRNDIVSALAFMADGNKLIGTLDGIVVVDSKGFVLNREEAKKVYPWIDQIDNSIKTLTLSRDQKTLWIATEMNGFYRVDLNNQTFKLYNKESGLVNFNYIPVIFEDSQSNIWIGSEELYFFDKTGKLFTYDGLRIKGNNLIQNSIETVFEDRDKNIWIGTYSAGVLKYSPENKQVLHYFVAIDNTALPNTQILSFAKGDNDLIWIGTDGDGLLGFNMSKEKFSITKASDKFSSKVIKSIHKTKEGLLWLGTWEGGMIKFDPSNNATEIFNPDKNNFKSIHVWDIKEDSIGNFWIATLRDGLCYFSPKSKTYKYFQNDEQDPSSLINDDVMTLLVDSRGIVWAGTSNGLSVLLPGKTTFSNFLNDTTEKSLSYNVINCLLEDKEGKIWIGTNGGGISIMDKNFKIVRIIKDKHGLPSNNISSLIEDGHDNIWASTYKGVVKIDHKNMTVDQVPQVGYLQEKEFITDSRLRMDDGRLLFGSTNGFDIFHPDSLRFNPTHENLVFTSLEIFNHEITKDSAYDGRQIILKSISQTEQINLSYKDYSFTLTFAPLTYNWQKSLRYSYFMEGLDKEWQYTTSDRRFVHYSNLTPGEYTLQVRASFDGKNWPTEPKIVRIVISPPWWGTLMFKILAVFLICLLLIAIYKFRVNFLERQQSKLARLVDVRTSELKRSYDELQQKNNKIETQKEEIQKLVRELSAQKNDIEQKNEELQTQHDVLSVKGVALEEAQKKLQDINRNLENLIERRTSKLNTAVRELETFLYRASHDLRGPISSMLGLIRVAELENGKSDEVYIDFMRKTTMRLERTLAKLVQKHTIQKTKIQKETITKEVLLDLLNEISLDIPHFRTENFEVNIQEELMLDSDKPMLAILLSNLLENAFFFSQRAENKKVTLEMYHENSSVILSVQDYGAGIQPDLKDKIFTMFFRGSELSTGNGLGLYLVQNALIRINGKITLETEVGVFTRFTVILESL